MEMLNSIKKICSTLLLLTGAAMAPAQNSWVTLPDFIGTPRASCVMFIIDDIVYAGTGRMTIPNPGPLFTNDFFKFDPATNRWDSIAGLPGDTRWMSNSFVIGSKGYVALGSGDSTYLLKEVWQYDPQADAWTRKNDFPGPARYGAFCFVIDTTAYIGGGQPGNYNNFWAYNSSSDTWIQKNNFPASGRHSAIAFTIDKKGYMGLGRDDTTVFNNDFWEYIPLTDSWTQKASFPDSKGRYIGTGFALNRKGYAGLGGITGAVNNLKDDFWEYDPMTNTWQSASNIPGAPRTHCVAVSNNHIAYIIGGYTENPLNHYLNDFYSFSVATNTGNPALNNRNEVSVYSTNGKIYINNRTNENLIFEAFDLIGKQLITISVDGNLREIDLRESTHEIIVYRVIGTSDFVITGKLLVNTQ